MLNLPTSSRALWHISPQESMVKRNVLTTTSEEVCIVQSNYSLISLGTEQLVAKGMVPSDLYQSMQVPYMAGSFDLPIKYGYSLVGTVISEGHPLLGKRVHLMHPHQDYCIVQPTAVFEVPDEVPSLRASLASNLETAISAVWDSEVSIGDRVLVVGFGMIGALTSILLKQIVGVEVYVADLLPERKVLAKQLGFTLLTDEDSFDKTFHTSGSSGGLQLAVDRLGFEGRVIELSWYGTKAVAVQLGGSFHQQRKQIIASQVGQIPGSKQNRWDYLRRKQLVFKLLEQPLFDQLLTDQISLEEAPALFQKLRKGKVGGLGWAIKYD